MKIFYITFQKNCFLRNSFLKIIASNESSAREYMKRYRDIWDDIIPAQSWKDSKFADYNLFEIKPSVNLLNVKYNVA